MQKKLVQSSLALAAATALGLGSAFVASPAVADNGPQKLNVQSDAKVQSVLEQVGEVNAYGAKNGKLTIGVSEGNDKADEVAKKYSNVNVIKGIDQLKPRASNDLVGGAGYLLEDGKLGGACSTGFSGWDADGKPIVLTAGHCAKIINKNTNEFEGDTIVDQTEQPSTATANGGEGFVQSGEGIIGQWGYNKFGGELVPPGSDAQPKTDDIDFAVINVDASKYNVKTGVTDWSTADSDDLSTKLATDITSVGAHTEGTVQKSGRTTGLTEDETWTTLNEQIDYMNIGGRFVHGFGVKASMGDPFSAAGDSGGGVFQGDTAVGVISGGGPLSEGGVEYDMSWVADLDYSLETSGQSISFTDPNEELPGDDEADADASAAADGEDADASSAADGEDADASAAADGDDANASDDADADGKEADASAAADGDDAEASAGADGAEADASAAADGDDADSSAAADGKDDEADSDADGDEKPEAPKVGDQTVVEGGKITGKAAPNAEVKLTWKPAGDAQAGSSTQAAPAEGTTTVKTDDDGNFSAEAPGEAGDYAYSATVTANGQTSEATNFTVTVQAAEAERNLTVEPKEISASDFVKEDKGVQITAEGFEEGENVTLEVVAGPENVEGITLEETANADGVVGFSIYGTSASNPEAYLGKYDLEVTGANDTEDEDALTGSFEVVADEDGNGGGNDGDDDGNGDGGSDLPRTGAELTGLAAGAGLLLVGGAAVVLTMRRKKNN
ncbi:S1 family peptidase [Brevibacterium linens]|uniref:LPXTG-motif cell wall anchor domain protein n=1 Tax=Brevibacterium linens TaxID=1703 RepID=A0A0B9AQW7_BRELN|nr:S1 family peptidase [Brevibacterium linens]KHS51758.1 LPXTG-motif cell wall anchor domain protein [Brevibacterium linens]